MTYKVLTDGTNNTDYTVELTGVTVKDGKVTINETVTKNGKEYKVTKIAADADNLGYGNGITSISVPVSLCSDLNAAIPGNKLGLREDYKIEITGNGKVGTAAFQRNRNITSVSFGPGITEIMDYAFLGCDWLTTIEDWGGVTSIGDCAFQECKFSELTIPETVTEIGTSAFAGWAIATQLTVNLPSTLQGKINAEAVFAPNNSAKQTLTIKYYDVTDAGQG